MITVKGLAIVALLVGGTSLALAQNGPPTGGQPPIAGGAGGSPANSGPPGPGVIPHDAPAPNVQAAAPPAGPTSGTRMATRHHMYMSAKSSRHKTLRTGPQLPKQPQ